MNWQAVIDSLRRDAKALQAAQLTLAKSEIASQAMVGTCAVTLAKIADALEMGLDKTDAYPSRK